MRPADSTHSRIIVRADTAVDSLLSVSAQMGPVMGASKRASSTGKAWVILIGGFFGVLLLELAHGTSAGYA